MLGVLPPDERLGADDLPGVQVDDRLVPHDELPGCDRVLERGRRLVRAFDEARQRGVTRRLVDDCRPGPVEVMLLDGGRQAFMQHLRRTGLRQEAEDLAAVHRRDSGIDVRLPGQQDADGVPRRRSRAGQEGRAIHHGHPHVAHHRGERALRLQQLQPGRAVGGRDDVVPAAQLAAQPGQYRRFVVDQQDPGPLQFGQAGVRHRGPRSCQGATRTPRASDTTMRTFGGSPVSVRSPFGVQPKAADRHAPSCVYTC